MSFSLREIPAADKFSAALTCQAVATAIPQRAIHQALTATGQQTVRTRKLDLPATIWTLIIMNLIITVSIGHAFRTSPGRTISGGQNGIGVAYAERTRSGCGSRFRSGRVGGVRQIRVRGQRRIGTPSGRRSGRPTGKDCAFRL